jgi:hypothetical protein
MNTNTKVIMLAAALAFAAGCASQTRTEQEFGDAVRAVSTAQIHDLGAAQYPASEAVTGGNAERLENVVRAHAEQGNTQMSTGAGASK